MAGRGPAPKSADRRARRNKDSQDLRIVRVEPDGQPSLPPLTVRSKIDGFWVSEEVEWPQVALDYWQMWADHPISKEYTALEWSELQILAGLYARYWMGDTSVAQEMRLRAQDFGTTPAARARLRIQFAIADEVETKGAATDSGARDRYKGLRAVVNE